MTILIKKNENFKESILLFLENIIKLEPKELVDYIRTKVDIYDLLFNKCILRKCIEKPLGEKNPFCLINQSQSGAYKLLFIILRILNINNKFIEIYRCPIQVFGALTYFLGLLIITSIFISGV